MADVSVSAGESADLRWEPSDRWVRGIRDDVTLVDSKQPVVLWPRGQRGVRYAFPAADVRADLLRPAASAPEGEYPAGVEHFDLVVGEQVLPGVAQRYPDLPDHLSVVWSAAEHWYEEDEEVFVGVRDPYWRVDPIRSTREVRVEIDGHEVGRTSSPLLVFESHLPVRYYLPMSDVRMEWLRPTETTTGCPYKGRASYWSFVGPDGDSAAPPDLAWAYQRPSRSVAELRDHISFWGSAVTLTVDGERVPV